MSKKQNRINKLILLANAIGTPCDLKHDSGNITHALFSIDRRDQIILHIESMLKDEGVSSIPVNSKVNK